MSIPSTPESRPLLPLWVGGLAIIIGVLACYGMTLRYPLIFDDLPSLVSNPSLNSLLAALRPPIAEGMTVEARPALNLSFALNRAFSGTDFAWYRATNILIHLVNGLLLMAVLFRALRLIPAKASEHQAAWMAAAVALIWSLHSLHTESVTYLVQRAESLAFTFYLLGFLGFLLLLSGRSLIGWVLGLLGCFIGVATKETVATAPLLMLIFDRAFAAGSFAEAAKRRGWFYAAAFSSWLLLGSLVWLSDGRGTSAGYDSGASVVDYLLTQAWAITTYLKLTFVPRHQVFDYGAELFKHVSDVWPYLIIVGSLFGTAAYFFIRNRAIGFLLAGFFVMLAPSSSFIPVATQAAAEHRTYPALIFPILLVAFGAFRLLGKGAVLAAVAASLALAVATSSRNQVYADEITPWQDSYQTWPSNPRAPYVIGSILQERGRANEALPYFQAAVDLNGVLLDAHLDGLARAQIATHDYRGALSSIQRAIEIESRDPVHYNTLGAALSGLRDFEGAIRAYRQAVSMNSRYAEAMGNLANCLMQTGAPAEAMPIYEQALTISPEDPVLHMNYALALDRQGNRAAAEDHYRKADSISSRRPGDSRIPFSFGCFLAATGKMDEAIEQFMKAVRLNPDHLGAHGNLGEIYAMRGQRDAAIAQYREVLRIDPGNAVATAAIAKLQ